jgi:hypothetical protein
MSEPESEFIVDADGVSHHTSAKLAEILRPYLKPCGEAPLLISTPLVEALAHKGTTVVEVPDLRVFYCHLRTALVMRGGGRPKWDILPWNLVLTNYLQGTPEDKSNLIETLDPLVILAASWPHYLAASQHIGDICQTRAMRGMPTLFVVTRLGDLASNADLFDPGFRAWLGACPKADLTWDSVRVANARDKAKMIAYHSGDKASSVTFGQAPSPSSPSTKASTGNVKQPVRR